mmetsp:Transcript_23008/g.29391  ORF Transcript_23008/g.29391 Transcript_23008/m.29391 type:complete len:118 (-) Transcript_23008:854-1207(-)
MKLSGLLLGFFTVLTTAESRRPTFVVPHAVLKLRGGAGPLDPTTLCKVSSGLCLAEGTRSSLGPKQANEAYGIPDALNDDIQQYHQKNLGTGILSLGVMLYIVSKVCVPVVVHSSHN